MKTFIKTPNAFLDYIWDWSDWLGLDTFSPEGITFNVTENLVIDHFTIDNGKVIAWVSGGILHDPEMIVCNVETVQGRRDSRGAIFFIEAR